MPTICAKSHHIRQANNIAPDWQCPSCSVAYNKSTMTKEDEGAVSSGYSLVGLCQASKRFHAAQAACFCFFTSPSQLLTAPVSSKYGCERIAPATHQDQVISNGLLSPWRSLPPPEEPWRRFVSNGFHRRVAAGFPSPTPGWLTLRAIRCTARATAQGG